MGVKNEVEYLTNAYREYTSGYATSIIRSTSEMLFEKYCEAKDDIEWIYKNGDTGKQYFSIVYIDGLQHQWLFYADYIVKKKDGSIWVIETKGGEAHGQDKNIDIQIENNSMPLGSTHKIKILTGALCEIKMMSFILTILYLPKIWQMIVGNCYLRNFNMQSALHIHFYILNNNNHIQKILPRACASGRIFNY